MLAKCLGAVGVRTAYGFLPSLACGQRIVVSNQLRASTSVTQRQAMAADALLADVSPLDWKPCYRAVLVDAAGTFLVPSEPVSTVYLRYAGPYGCRLSDDEVLERFRRAYNMPWAESPLRYVGDARPFWHRIVEQSTGCERPEVSEAIYQYYSRAEAWHVTPGAMEALRQLKSAGVLLAVVSNFDTRLRPLLRELRVDDLFDAVIVSAEVRAEKPNPVIFDAAVRTLSAAATTRGTLPITGGSNFAAAAIAQQHARLYPLPSPPASCHSSQHQHQQQLPYPVPYGRASPFATDFGPLAPEQVVHVGDDRRNDCWGARDAGINAWLWGYDVRSWAEVADRVLLGSQADDYYEDRAYAAER